MSERDLSNFMKVRNIVIMSQDLRDSKSISVKEKKYIFKHRTIYIFITLSRDFRMSLSSWNVRQVTCC